MKRYITLLLIILFQLCRAQSDTTQRLTVSPNVNLSTPDHKLIVSSLKQFLTTKNNSATANANWLSTDFTAYVYPYLDILDIEQSRHGKNFYQPTLLELVPVEDTSKFIVKLAFIGHHLTNGENQLRAIYNVMAQLMNGKVVFSKYTTEITKSWKNIKKGNISYKISPLRKVDQQQLDQQQKEIEKLLLFFNAQPIDITYYSCTNAQEVFRIKGFDYHPLMYNEKYGGLAETGNIIYSGNDAEIYTHEIVHLYTSKLFPNKNSFLDEGLATLLAGSGKQDYVYHRKQLQRYLKQNPNFQISQYPNVYQKLFFEKETPVLYTYSAVICEYIIQNYGKEKLFALLNSGRDLWENLVDVGLSKENIQTKLNSVL